MTLTVGSLCSGYEGISLGLSTAGIEHRTVFVADPDPGATTVLEARFPDVPNLGDITTVDWRTVAPVDLLTAGYPCQPFSTAGKRKGTKDVRHLWPHIADAVRVVRPRWVLLENVAGHRSLGFGRVLADLAALGYVGSWCSVRASDVGAAHKRERVFILAWREGDSPAGIVGRVPAVRPGRGGGADPVLSLLPTPRATDTGTEGRRASEGFRPPLSEVVLPLFPTPRTSDTNGAGAHGNGGLDLRTAVTLLPTPMAADGGHGRGSSAGNGLRNTAREIAALPPAPTGDVAAQWGDYAPAIARWESFVGRPAPDATEPGKQGKPRLSPRFVEWLMGLPAGWVTTGDVYLPDVDPRPVRLSRVQALRLLGNGVVPQQLAHALHLLVAASPSPGSGTTADAR